MSNSRLHSILLLTVWLFLGCDLKFQETNSLILDAPAIRLTQDLQRKTGPTWSPDGTIIAFASHGSATNLLRQTLHGDEVGRVGRVEEDIRSSKIALSPAGDQMVYRSNFREHLWIVNFSDGSERQLTIEHPDARRPSWSPDGQWIAYDARDPNESGSNSHIWRIPVQGGEAQRLTESSDRHFYPTWSPDSRFIAFQAFRDGHMGIWIRELSTGVEQRLSPDSTESRAPDWSPDGKKIAFHMLGTTGNDIWTVSVADSALFQVTMNVEGINPSWSSDGAQIAYRVPDGVWVSSVSGDLIAQTDIFDFYPTWFPGEEILIAKERVEYSNIKAYLLADSLIFSVTEPVDNQFDIEPAWFPDSRRIVFGRREQNEFATQTLWTKSILGGEARPLNDEDPAIIDHRNPAVSPDGNWLVFDDRFRLFLMPLAAGGSAIDLSPFIGINLTEPDWSPDSRGLVCNNRTNLKIFTADSNLVVEEMTIPGNYATPVWSQAHPVFGSHFAAANSSGILVMKPDGSSPSLAVARAREPSWSPDATRLVFILDLQLYVLPVFRAFPE